MPRSRHEDEDVSNDADILAEESQHIQTLVHGAGSAPLVPRGTDLSQCFVEETALPLHDVLDDDLFGVYCYDIDGEWSTSCFDLPPGVDSASLDACREFIEMRGYTDEDFEEPHPVTGAINGASHRGVLLAGTRHSVFQFVVENKLILVAVMARGAVSGVDLETADKPSLIAALVRTIAAELAEQ